MDNEIYNSLRSRKLLDILDGDTGFGIIKIATSVNVPIQMPYLTGKDLAALSEKFGYPVRFPSALPDRRAMLSDVIAHCILNEQSEDLLNFLLSKEQFRHVLEYVSEDNMEEAYETLLTEIERQINFALSLQNVELQCQNGRFFLTGPGTTAKKTVLNTITTDTVKDFYVHAENDIEQGNFESALSRSRNMLEQAFCYAIEKAEAVPVDGKNVERLYRQVKDLYPLESSSLVTALDSVITALSNTEHVDDTAIAELYMHETLTAVSYVLSLIQ